MLFGHFRSQVATVPCMISDLLYELAFNVMGKLS